MNHHDYGTLQMDTPDPGSSHRVKYLSPSVVSLVSWMKMMEKT